MVRTDWPSATEAGRVENDWEAWGGVTRDKAERVLISLLLGGTSDSHRGWEWPIDPEAVSVGARSDAEHARFLAHEYLELDEVGWSHLRWKACQLTKDRAYRRLVVRISEELERREVLYADDLQTLMEETKCST